MGERALHFKIRADPPESAASPLFFAMGKILAWIIHDEFGESGKGHGFHRLRKNSRMYGSPWKSGPSGPRKPCEISVALAPVVVLPRQIAFFRSLFQLCRMAWPGAAVPTCYVGTHQRPAAWAAFLPDSRAATVSSFSIEEKR